MDESMLHSTSGGSMYGMWRRQKALLGCFYLPAATKTSLTAERTVLLWSLATDSTHCCECSTLLTFSLMPSSGLKSLTRIPLAVTVAQLR